MPLDPRRKDYLTASNMAAACGLSPFMSRQKLFRTIKGLEPPFEGNEFTQWGIDHESDAIHAYESFTGDFVDNANDDQQFVHRGIYGATVDGDVGLKIIEVKCPFSQEIPDTPKPYYMTQVQGQMYVTATEEADFVVWTPDALGIWHVEFNQEYWDKMDELMTEFLQYVEDGIEPKRKKKAIMPEIKMERIL